ncbi:RNA polymerase III-inhibiting protein MAF1 [Nakaseomyces bracarensis]|uniref:RNA polymerase III-inhibiting protein MAF1 n=1 Tax=Nakaseomyces bracarensis TaxID=273131 RepID=UPI0038710E1C
MKFIDELDIERVNQVLNFETIDCKIVGGCDIFTTKAVASDRKLYKTIDHHLDTILQDNESYNLALQHQISMDKDKDKDKEDVNREEKEDRVGELDGGSPTMGRRDSSSFWEQKRRMSVSESPIYLNKIGSVGNGYMSSNGNGFNGVSQTTSTEAIAAHDSVLSTPVVKTSKLNDQNLKDLVSSYDSGYTSSSSVESSTKGKHVKNSKRADSMDSAVLKNNTNSNNSDNHYRRRSSLNELSPKLNLGPFGPISEPSSRRTFAYLIAILNASYPDHDFSLLEPNDFKRSSIKSFIAKFENSMYSLGRNPEEWIWEIINSHMTLSDCVLYQYAPTQSFLDDEPGHLWSLIGFLFNKKRKRVAFVYLIASRLKITMNNSIGTEDDMRNGDRLRDNENRDFDVEGNQYEGEYDLTYDEHVIDDDEEE